MAVVGHEGLGDLVKSLEWDDATTFRRTAGRRVHRFDHGLVVPTKNGPLALPYRELRIYRSVTHHLAANTMLLYISTDWQFQARDGTVWKPGLTRDRRETTDSEPAVFYDRVLETTCAHQRDELWRRLLERAALTFGRVAVNLEQVTISQTSVPWTEVLRIKVEKGALKITARLDGRWVKEHHISAGATSALPNLPLLWELLHAAHAYALAQATSGNSTDSP